MDLERGLNPIPMGCTEEGMQVPCTSTVRRDLYPLDRLDHFLNACSGVLGTGRGTPTVIDPINDLVLIEQATLNQIG